MRIRLLIAACIMSMSMMAANTVTNRDTRITSAVTVGSNVDYTLTLTSNLFSSNGSLNIPISAMEHSVIIFKYIKPSVVKSNWLSYIKINGSTASDGTNCQVKMYGSGTIILPYGSNFQPLTCYTETNFSGSSYSGYTTGSDGGFMKTLDATSLINNFKSFKLKRGYMVTFATGTAGYGYSRCFIADTEDLEMNLPAPLIGKVSSYRLFKWNDAQKKGIANDTGATSNAALNTSWCYTYGVGENRYPDQECIPHKIHKNWPGVADCGGVDYACHMKTDNEPANGSDDTPGTVDEILGYWEDAMRTGMRLCAPSSHDGGYGWQEEFMNAIDARGWRCDILDLHCYWVESSFSDNNLNYYYNKYHRPIWISEWIWGASWNSNGAFASGVSDTDIRNTTGRIITTLNNNDNVERYAYWNTESKAKVYDNGLTALGSDYASVNSGIAYKKSKEFVPVVVIKNPYGLTESAVGQVSLTWKDANGDMMDEIRVQYKAPGDANWTTLATVTKKDKTGTGDNTYTYTTNISSALNYSFRIVDIYENTEYPSNATFHTNTTTDLTYIPANTDDYFFQIYSKEANSDLVWSVTDNSNDVSYQVPATNVGDDLKQLWTFEENSYGGLTLRNLSNSEYVMCSPNAWNFNTNNDSYKAAASKATYLPIYYSNGDYFVMKNVGHNLYVGLWDADKNFGVGEVLAGNRTNANGNGNDSGDKLGIRAIPKEIVYENMGIAGIAGNYYLYNVSSGTFLTGANDWGTQASLADTGLDFDILADGDHFIIDSRVSNGGDNHYFGSNRYMDAASANWIVTESGTYNGKKTYSLTTDGTNFVAAPTSGSVVTTMTNANNDRAKWVFMTKNDLVNQMAQATETSPVNATFLLPGYGFSRNDTRNGNWQGNPTVNGQASNMNGEKYNTTFDVYQELAVPNGIYEVTMQGFYREGGVNAAATLHSNGNESLNAVMYLNDVETPLPSIFEGAGRNGNVGTNSSLGYIPNGQGDASQYFNAGLYTVGPVRVTVEDGTLRIGVKKDVAVGSDWAVFDNFKLMYYGGPAVTFLGLPAWNITDDTYIQSFNNITVSYPSASTTAPGATFGLIGNNPTATLSDGQNTYNATLSLNDKTITMNFNGFTLEPGKDYTVTLPQNTVGFEDLKTNDELTISFHTPVIFDNTYYIYNNSVQKYVSRNGRWNTQAVVDDYGLAIKVETDAQGNTHLKCFDNNLSIFDDGTRLFADGGTPMNFTPAVVTGGYRFKNKANDLYLGVNGTDLMANIVASNATTTWTLEPLADHTANYTRNADAQAVQVATDANLTGVTTAAALATKLASDYEAHEITVTGAKEEKYQQYAGTVEEGSKYDYFTETVTGLQPGIYRLSADAFQRAAWNDWVASAGGARGLIFLFANDAKTQLKSVMDYGATTAYDADFAYEGLHYPNNETSAYSALETGNYNNEVYVYVPADQGSSTGTLTFGVEIENRMGNGINTGTWAVYDNFKLEYFEPYYILDEIAATAPASASNVKVKFKRTIVAKTSADSGNAWNTICFPFNLTSQQITDIFGANTLVKELTSASPVGDSFSLGFTAVTAIEANKPYIMQVEQGDTEYLIEGLDIVPSENLTQTVGGVQFVGNYVYPCVMANTNGEDYYILNDVFKHSTGSTKIKGFRAYFHVPSSSSVKGLCFADDGTTGILEITDDMFTAPADIYSVGGQLLRKNATNMDDLPKGIYIVNGKKVLKSR